MTTHVVSASAGTGKTYRLATEMAEAVMSGEARPEAIVAITYTNKAAAELARRLRERLLKAGREEEAARIRDGYLGTVHAIGQRLAAELAFEAGTSPWPTPAPASFSEALFRASVDAALEDDVGVLDALARRLSMDVRDDREKAAWDRSVTWRDALDRAVKAAVENRLDPEAVAAAAEASWRDLSGLLDARRGDGPALDARVETGVRDLAELVEARARDEIDKKGQTSKTTEDRLQEARRMAAVLRDGEPLAWRDLASFTKSRWDAKFLAAHVDPLREVAAVHLGHPRLHEELATMVREVFTRAAAVQRQFLARKAQERVVDFEDMLAAAADLLRHPAARARLAGRFDLVLVDEFQDTSPVQLEVVLGLASLAPRSLWVGDRKQSIYGFQGSDPTLMEQAADAVLAGATPEVLGRSFRSRPPLVELCSSLFSRAFPAQGVPAHEVAVSPACPEPVALDGTPAVHLWRLAPAPGQKKVDPFASTARGVAELLAHPPLVREAADDPTVAAPTRPAGLSDVAVLARTNRECEAIAGGLRALGFEVRVALPGLGDQPETWLLRAGLAFLVDPRDRLAAAELSWLGGAHANPDDWLAARVAARAASRWEDLHDDPTVAEVLALADRARELSPTEAVDAVLSVLDAPRRTLAWTDPERRLANLEALRAEARAFEDTCATRRVPATVAGLVAHLEGLPGDAPQAVSGSAAAITVMTWHKAKGLEWPVVVLSSLDHEPGLDPYALRVEPAPAFDPETPLAGRGLRWWPNPYGSQKQKMVLTERAEQACGTHARRLLEEDVRLVYVAFTRARDHLVLTALARGDGAAASRLDRLVGGDGQPLLSLPWATPGDGVVGVAGDVRSWRCTVLHLDDHIPDALAATPERPGWFRAPAEVTPRAPLALSPSAVTLDEDARRAVAIVQIERLGDRQPVRVAGDRYASVGDAVHGFLAADLGRNGDGSARLALAERLISAHGLGGSLDPRGVVAMGDALDAWLERKAPGQSRLPEWPVRHLRADGRLVRGAIDLLVPLADGGWLLIDHKTFPGDAAARDERARSHAGQLAAYAAAVEVATGRPVRELWLHLPVRGECVRVQSGG